MIYILRSAASYLFLLLMIRLTGPRELKELAPIDFVTAIVVGTIAAAASFDLRVPLWVAFASIGTWAGLNILLSYLNLKSKFLRDILQGRPVVLVESGRVRKDNLTGSRYNLDNLLSQLRYRGITRVEDVELAVLEPTGELSVVKNPSTVEASTLKTLNQAIALNHAGLHNRAAVRLAELGEEKNKEEPRHA